MQALHGLKFLLEREFNPSLEIFQKGLVKIKMSHETLSKTEKGNQLKRKFKETNQNSENH